MYPLPSKQQLLLAAIIATSMGITQNAYALGSVEAINLGDQGYYWDTGAEVWILPQRLSNVDNRAMLQWFGGGAGALSGNTIAGAGPANGLYNLTAAQASTGGGLVLELSDNFNMGVWFSAFNPDFMGGGSTFTDRAISATGYTDGPIPQDTFNSSLAERKVDLFLSYGLKNGLDLGLRLWFGSTGNTNTPDDSTGPLAIDELSDGTIVNRNSAASRYTLTDFGLGVGLGFSGIEGMRFDFGGEIGLQDVGWRPNSLGYASIGGVNFAINLRSHIELSKVWTIGGFARVGVSSMKFKPKKQRDGGNLLEWDRSSDDTVDTPSTLGAGLATDNNGETPAGLKYNESRGEWQVGFLAKAKPNSKATLHAVIGVGGNSIAAKASIRSDYLRESKASLQALPFVQISLTGHVVDYLDVYLAAGKRWQSRTRKFNGFDVRIPDNDSGQGGTPPTPIDNTNRLRRTYTRSRTASANTTTLSFGARYHVQGLAMQMQIDPAALLRGPYFITGTAGAAPFFWLSASYDWDQQDDIESGNGEHPSLHVPQGPTLTEVSEDQNDADNEGSADVTSSGDTTDTADAEQDDSEVSEDEVKEYFEG